MALSDIFGKKKEPPQPPGPAPGGGLPPGLQRQATSGQESPVDMVVRMKRQGMNQQQIVQAMQREGFSQTQIWDAIDTATQQEQGRNSSPPGPPSGPPIGPPGAPAPLNPPQGSPMHRPMPPQPSRTEHVDELIEKTVQEKWDQFSDQLKQLDEFKRGTDNRIAAMESKIEGLENKFDNLKNAIIAKIKDYDTSILNVGTEMKAMEQVFQKILPELQENVSELSRVTKRVSKKK